VSYPPIPLDVQLFVWGPGFHPRLLPCGVGGPPKKKYANLHADVRTLFGAFYTTLAITPFARGRTPDAVATSVRRARRYLTLGTVINGVIGNPDWPIR
jgi:hypothetical protein